MQKFPVGIHSFADLRAGDFYYADKTSFIKKVLDLNHRVVFFSRPKSFGKTLFLDTIKEFFQIDPENPGSSKKNAELFSGLRVFEDKEFCKAFMGQHPVISFSLKSVRGKTFKEATLALAKLMARVAGRYRFLIESQKLIKEEREEVRRLSSEAYLQDKKNYPDLSSSLLNLACNLYRHCERQIVILVDDADAPLASAAANGYYEKMRSLLVYFLDVALFPSLNHERYLKAGLLTGSLPLFGEDRISICRLESMRRETVLTEFLQFRDAFGFIEAEAKALLQNCGLESRFHEVKRWYGGYQIAGCEIFSPNSLIEFCKKAIDSDKPLVFAPTNEWSNSESDALIDCIFGFLSSEEAVDFQKLLDGGTIDVKIEMVLQHTELDKKYALSFWTYLLHTGCLTAVDCDSEDAYRFKVKIPNEEIREIFKKKALEFSSKEDA